MIASTTCWSEHNTTYAFELERLQAEPSKCVDSCHIAVTTAPSTWPIHKEVVQERDRRDHGPIEKDLIETVPK